MGMKSSDFLLHPLNNWLYGPPDPGQELLDSIEQIGILEPIVYAKLAIENQAPRLYILSGSRRWAAAISLAIQELPTREVSLTPLEAERFLIECNRQRVKSKGQKIKEYQKLKEIEEELSKQRQREHGGTAPGKPRSLAAESNGSDEGESRVRAAKQVGLGVESAEKGLKILKEAGSGNAKAREVMAELDRGETSVAKAYRELFEPPANDSGNEDSLLSAMDDFEAELTSACEFVEVFRSTSYLLTDQQVKAEFIQRVSSKIQVISQILMVDKSKGEN